MATELEVLIVADVKAWRRWLARNHARAAGVWLTLAKKGSNGPTTLSYDEALEEALCNGWIDGQVRRNDEHTYHQRFTPRRARSAWSKRNVGIVGRLQEEGRMRSGGLEAVAQAQADGRWESAYPGAAEIEVPADLAVALAANPRAKATFSGLSAQNRYAILYRLHGVKRAQTRAQRIDAFVQMLARGETPYPQRERGRAEPGRTSRAARPKRS